MGRLRLLGGLAAKDRRGTAALEFGLIAPALLLVVFGGAEIAIVLNDYLTLTNATIVGATQFAYSGSSPTPYTDTVAAIQSAAPNLTPNITLSVNGASCGQDTACATAMAPRTGYVTVTTSYSCKNLNIVFNLLPNCLLTSQETERVQ